MVEKRSPNEIAAQQKKEHEAYLLYREGRISRHEWSRILLHGFDLDNYKPKLPWWKRIFKGRSFA